MNTTIITGSRYGELSRQGIIEISGSDVPTLDEKMDCVETVIRLGDGGWAIAGHLATPLGKLTRRAADAIGAPFINLDE
jgi:hypothetical protein